MRKRSFKEQRERLANRGGNVLVTMRLKLIKCLPLLLPCIFLIALGLELNPDLSSNPKGYIPAMRVLSLLSLSVGSILLFPAAIFPLVTSVTIYDNALYIKGLTRMLIFFPEEIAYIRFGGMKQSVQREVVNVRRDAVYIRPKRGKEIRLLYQSYGDALGYFYEWQTLHKIPSPYDE